MNQRVSKWALAIGAVVLFALPVWGFWTHQLHDEGDWKACTGEFNDPSYAPSCHATTPWGDEIWSSSSGNTCWATICCGAGPKEGFCFTCTAGPTYRDGLFPPVCGAEAQEGRPADSFAWCKSDEYGLRKLRCS